MSHRKTSATMASLAFALALAGCTDAPAAPTSSSPDLSVSGRTATIYVQSLPVKDSLASGEQLQLIGVGLDRRGRLITNSSLTWTSGDAKRATVSVSGRVTAMTVGGPVVITATNGVLSGSKTLYIKVAAAAPAAPAPPADTTAPPTTPPPTTPPPTTPPPTTPPPTTPPPTTPPPTVPPVVTADTGWTFCLNVGNTCVFNGTRDVRLVGAGGTSVVKDVRGMIGIDCAGYAFPNGGAISGSKCEFGAMKTVALANPRPGVGGLAATVMVPMGSPGSTAARSSSSGGFNGTRVADGLGAFRTKCELSGFFFDDPIVMPGQVGGSHLHMVFGNKNYSANLDEQSLASGASTCLGGGLNRSAYWMPAVFDPATGDVKLPLFGEFYYKSGAAVDISQTQDIPAGLRMVAGNKNATSNDQNPHVTWLCGNVYPSASIPDCPAGAKEITLAISFPSCWDGRNLDSPDHQSHMAYTVYDGSRSTCPSTHPVLIPKIDELFPFPIRANDDVRRWRLASDMYSTSIRGGLSAHADWMLGWDAATMHSIVVNCLRKGLDCGVGTIGNGLQLY